MDNNNINNNTKSRNKHGNRFKIMLSVVQQKLKRNYE